MTATILSISTPPAFDASQWPDSPRVPAGYKGTQFDFGLVAELIKFVDGDTVKILGAELRAVNVQTELPAEDPNYPIYFELIGLCRAFTVSIWADRIEISVCRIGTFEVLSTMFPSTESELRLALQDVVDSCY